MRVFKQIGEDRYTCVPPPGFEIDPAVTAAIREFDQGMIPLWRIQLWQTPWSPAPERVVHHGIGRYYPIPRLMKRELRIEMPADADFQAPNFLDAIFEDSDTIMFRMGGPGLYIPWNWNVYYWCRWQFDRLTAEKWDEAVDRRKARLAKLSQQWQDDIEYRRRQIEPWIMKKLEMISDADWEAYMQAVWGAQPGPRKFREPKPFVDLGRSPRPQQTTYRRVAPA